MAFRKAQLATFSPLVPDMFHAHYGKLFANETRKRFYLLTVRDFTRGLLSFLETRVHACFLADKTSPFNVNLMAVATISNEIFLDPSSSGHHDVGIMDENRLAKYQIAFFMRMLATVALQKSRVVPSLGPSFLEQTSANPSAPDQVGVDFKAFVDIETFVRFDDPSSQLFEEQERTHLASFYDSGFKVADWVRLPLSLIPVLCRSILVTYI